MQVPVGHKTIIFAAAKDLKVSAESGCQSCMLIWNALLFRKSSSQQALEDDVELQVVSGQPLLTLFRPRNGQYIYISISILTQVNSVILRLLRIQLRFTPLHASWNRL
jgi:hypothetical protein